MPVPTRRHRRAVTNAEPRCRGIAGLVTMAASRSAPRPRLVGVASPTTCVLADSGSTLGRQSISPEPPRSWRNPIPYTSWNEESGAPGETCWHFFHTLTELIGGLCATGFEVLRFAESEDADLRAQPGSYQHIAGFSGVATIIAPTKAAIPRSHTVEFGIVQLS